MRILLSAATETSADVLPENLGNILRTVRNMELIDYIDIACVSILLYYLFKFIRDRRAGKLAIKKAEHQRMYAFELWCWRRLLRVPWIARRSNQSILKDINPEYALEELMLKLQYFDHLIQRANSLEKTLMLGKIEGRRRRG